MNRRQFISSSSIVVPYAAMQVAAGNSLPRSSLQQNVANETSFSFNPYDSQTLSAEDFSGDIFENSRADLNDQMIAFQISENEDGPVIVDTTEITPQFEGSENPDVVAAVSMESFHLGAQEETEDDSRATVRLILGKDPGSSDDSFDLAFWTITAGLQLYDSVKGEKANAGDLQSDFHQALGRRRIEVPGGLGQLRFDVLRHKEPPWWKKIFKFITGPTGTALTAAIGFPALAPQAIGFLDELLERLSDSDSRVLFAGRPLKLALSQKAKDDYLGGVSNVKMGSLRPGFVVLARGRDFRTLNTNAAYYHATYRKLVAKDMSLQEILDEGSDPFKDVTYSVLRLRMRETKLSLL